ncbi:MAG TPA: DUF1329 domain-containing protein [Myxococcota bacterium]|jgi:hypothetical protein|nr:DUF1329 domain-containing protein [Myxococcota bacterium]
MPRPAVPSPLRLARRSALVSARRPLLGVVLGCLLVVAGAAPARAGLPPEGSCPTVAGTMPERGGEDVQPVVIREGLAITAEQLTALRTLVPPEVWDMRGAFFHEGMRMEIGPCHRRYPVDAAYDAATQAHAAKVKVDEKGNLEGYVAGLPFPPDSIDAAAPDAGVRWAWNLALRYRGVGPHGKFRLTDFPSRIGAPETYIGSFFLLQLAARADLADNGYREKDAPKDFFAAGGRFDEPFNARHLAWRQLRPLDSFDDYREIDDIFVYVPTMRKARRAASGWIDGLYFPRYTAGGDSGGSPVPFGSNGYGPTSSISPNSGLSIAQTENMRRGLTGLILRPNAFAWTYGGERDVLAPLNGARGGWPETADRNFGESGLSVASDRWDLRHAVVIDGVARESTELVRRLRIYVDWQTQQPLYWIGRRSNGLVDSVGILVHRFSGDVSGYPAWPDGHAALVFDPVAAAFVETEEGGTGWRRESYGILSVPTSDMDVRTMSSTDALQRGR